MSLNKISSFLDSFDEPSIVMDANYRILCANPAYLRDFSNDEPVLGRLCVTGFRTVSACLATKRANPALCRKAAPAAKKNACSICITPRAAKNMLMLRPHRSATTTESEHSTSRPCVWCVRRVVGPRRRGLVGRSPAFTRMLARVMRVAPSMATVMLLGETGTGKELVAGRSTKPVRVRPGHSSRLTVLA